MKSSVIRLVIVFATASIIGIAVIQVYWVTKAFNLNEDQFNRDVNIALYNVATNLFEISKTKKPSTIPIEQLSSNYYVVTINNEIDAGELERLLKSEFQKRNINANFEYGIYDCNNDQMVYCNLVTIENEELESNIKATLPKWGKQQYYFGVNFPNKELQIINRMGVWIFSTIVLLLVIIFFAYASFIIFKQKRLSEIQKDFINNMTHEFKTPISTIALSAEVLKKPEIMDVPGRLLSYATIIQNESSRLKTQVDRVLQMAALDEDPVVIKKERFDIHKVIEETIHSILPKIESLNGTIHLTANAGNGNVNGDKLHLTNILFNIFDNAIKYCGNSNPRIEITTQNQAKCIEINIKDYGIGIAKQQQSKIFDKFYRVPTGNTHDVKGYGLGLYYVKLMMKAHGGSIRLESELNEGSVFTLKFPNA